MRVRPERRPLPARGGKRDRASELMRGAKRAEARARRLRAHKKNLPRVNASRKRERNAAAMILSLPDREISVISLRQVGFPTGGG